jgi:hypothetical protein
MPVLSSYDYAVVRIVPRVERDECLNVGIILFCRTRGFLGARIRLNSRRLAALAPELDQELITVHLERIPLICAGGKESGPIGQLSQSERFHWLVSPRSTVIQTSPVHSGLCSDPEATLQSLLDKLVAL